MMELLLDTHIFLWFLNADKQLPQVVKDQIRDPQNNVYLSVASLWEIIIKNRLGKLPLPHPPGIYIPQ
jgi:PIN domain nuclease of toxin-antitoxin system